MKLFLFSFLGIVACVGKRSPNTSSSLLTEETNSALSITCNTNVYDQAKEDAEAQREELCDCLRARPEKADVASACSPSGGVTKNALAIYTRYKSRWPTDFIALDPNKNTTCLDNLTHAAIERYYFGLMQICKRTDLPTLKPFIAHEEPPADNHSCWELTGMTAEGCFEAEPCVGTMADLKYLPLEPSRSGLTSDKITLCNTAIQNIHHLKDPDNRTYLYNNPFALELCHGNMHNPGNYAAANCHGTAQAVIGGPLGSLEMTDVEFRSLADEKRCDDLATRTLASKHPATVASLPLNPGGLLINMDHSPQCSADDCGKVSLYVNSCTPTQLNASTFVNQMCVQCWSRLVESAGLKRLSSASTPLDLKPGCLLTQQDHSVVTVLQSHNLCYFYEATSPYGPPQLRVKPCTTLWNSFDLKWCPDRAMTFTGH